MSVDQENKLGISPKGLQLLKGPQRKKRRDGKVKGQYEDMNSQGGKKDTNEYYNKLKAEENPVLMTRR